MKENGAFESVEVWGKKKLAYPIKKFQEGIYMLFNFASTPDVVEELKRIQNISEEIIKYIIIKRD